MGRPCRAQGINMDGPAVSVYFYPVMKFFFLLISSLFFLGACSTSQAPAPVVNYGAGEGAGSAGAHIVGKGETLYSISERYQLAIRDIANMNGLNPPFVLTRGERLNLPPPRQYRVRAGDTLYRVSRLFGVGSSEIARLNELKSPYKLSTGQSLRLPSPTRPVETPQQIAQAAAPVFTREEATALDAVPPPSVEISRLDEPQPRTQGTQPQPQPQVRQTQPQKKSPITAKTPPRQGGKFMRPVDGKILSGFGPKSDGLHNDGINIAAPKGAPVRAAENGVVVYAGNELKGSGNLVLVRHEGHIMTAYAHMDRTLVSRGAVIKRGQTIGTVGSSGSVSTPQLHFEVRQGTKAINPSKYLG